MWDNRLQIHKVCHGKDKSQFSMLMMNRAVSRAYITEKRIPVGKLETLSNDKNSKAMEQADHEVFNIRGFST